MTEHPALSMTAIASDALLRVSARYSALYKQQPMGMCLERFELLILGKLISLPDGQALTFSSLFGFLERYRQIEPDETWLAELNSQCLLADQAWSAVSELLHPTTPQA